MILAFLWTSGIVLLLTLLNGLYVGTEFAILATRRSQLEVLARSGRRSAVRMLGLVSDLNAMDRSIAALQVGITVASLGLGMYGEHSVAHLIEAALAHLGPASWAISHALASAVAVVGLTFLHVVLGEVVPKSIALQNPPRAILWLEAPLRITRIIAWPLVVVLAGVSQVILRLLGVGRDHGRAAMSLEEIDSIIEESGAGGALPPHQARILANVVAFEDLPLHKVMVPRNKVSGLPVDAGWEQVQAVLEETEFSRYPVYDGELDNIIGYVHVKDLMQILDAGTAFDLRGLCRAIPYLPETASSASLLRQFRMLRSHIAVVVDEHGGTAGVVTLEDLVEEIFGEVQDEFDAEEQPSMRRIDDHTVVARGNCRLDELNDALELKLTDEHVATIAGLVLKKLGRMARPGDSVRTGRLQVTVEAVERLAITRVRLAWRVGPPPEGA